MQFVEVKELNVLKHIPLEHMNIACLPFPFENQLEEIQY
jgi:hypothetical protein